jgi:hypothetical protein
MIDRLLVFGANGDLSGRYLLPALAALQAAGLLTRRFELIAVGRHDWSDEEFRRWAAEQLSRHGGRLPRDAIDVVRAFARYSKRSNRGRRRVGVDRSMRRKRSEPPYERHPHQRDDRKPQQHWYA